MTSSDTRRHRVIAILVLLGGLIFAGTLFAHGVEKADAEFLERTFEQISLGRRGWQIPGFVFLHRFFLDGSRCCSREAYRTGYPDGLTRHWTVQHATHLR